MTTLDLILSGSVLTMDTGRPFAEAIGVKAGRIAAVGDYQHLSRSAGSQTSYLDLQGRSILPGFIDTHVHPVKAGAIERHVDLSHTTAVADILAALADKAARTPAGQPVLAFNFNGDIVRERRLPTLAEMDGVSDRHPLAVIVYDVHSAQLNTPMLAWASLPGDGPGVIRDAAGNLTGRMEDPAIDVVLRKIQPSGSEQIGEAVRAAVQQALRQGLTTVHMKESPGALPIISDMAARLPIRIKQMAKIDASDLSGYTELLNSEIIAPGTVVAMYADGAPDSKTAAFFEPYCDDPSNFGMLQFEDRQLEELVARAHQKDLQVSVHACGTRATEQVLAVYEKVLAEHPRGDHRHRIEHFEMPLGNHIRRAVKAGISLAMQPAFLFLSGEDTFENIRSLLGDERLLRWKPLRSILDAGGLVAGGSDAPVTPMSPLKGIQACVTHPNAAERITRYEAIQLFTSNAARVGFEENLKGSIAPGKLADFTVLAENPFTVDSDRIGQIQVEMTIVGGEVVFSRSD